MPLSGTSFRTNQSPGLLALPGGHPLLGRGWAGASGQGCSAGALLARAVPTGLFMKSQWPRPAMSTLFMKSTMLVRLASCISAGFRDACPWRQVPGVQTEEFSWKRPGKAGLRRLGCQQTGTAVCEAPGPAGLPEGEAPGLLAGLGLAPG